MIAIIDSGVANLESVKAAFDRINVDAVITSVPHEIAEAERVILPGVGAAPAAMRELQKRGLVEAIQKLTQPVLGICLGMQLLFETSEEGAQEGKATPCLGVIEGRVKALSASFGAPIPHMGWNGIQITNSASSLLCDIADGSFMYFVHSFAAPVDSTTLAQCDYGQPFTAICGQKNFWGCQFHPERSGAAGQQILRNFMKVKM